MTEDVVPRKNRLLVCPECGGMLSGDRALSTVSASAATVSTPFIPGRRRKRLRGWKRHGDFFCFIHLDSLRSTHVFILYYHTALY